MSVIERIVDPANEARNYPPLFNYNGQYHRGRTMQSTDQPTTLNYSPSPTGTGAWNPTFDLRDNKSAYELEADLPGVDQNDIRIEFTEDTTLRISGHKKQRQASQANSPIIDEAAIESEEEWLRTVNSIDAATIGPRPGARRTSVVNARTYKAPTENIDQWTAAIKKKDTKRRPSITNAQYWQQPPENIDAYSHSHVHAEQRRSSRRISVIDAATYEMPAENIDGATRGPLVMPVTVVKKFSFPRPELKDNIDAATIGNPRNIDQVVRPRSRRRSQQQQQPWLVAERPAGAFERIFRFPSPVNKEGVKASLENGVLTVSVPKLGLVERSRVGSSAL